jgi:hypothetical protein
MLTNYITCLLGYRSGTLNGLLPWPYFLGLLFPRGYLVRAMLNTHRFSVNIDAPTLFRKNFRTNFLASLPRGFPSAFHALLRSTLAAPALDVRLFPTLDLMGLLQDHEALVASVIHEAIEKRVKEVVEEDNGETSVLQIVKTWFTESVVPWMAMTYGRGLTDRE